METPETLLARILAILPPDRRDQIQALAAQEDLPPPLSNSEAAEEVARRYALASQEVTAERFSGPLDPKRPFSDTVGDWVRDELRRRWLEIAQAVHFPNNDLRLAHLFRNPALAHEPEYAEHIRILLDPEAPLGSRAEDD